MHTITWWIIAGFVALVLIFVMVRRMFRQVRYAPGLHGANSGRHKGRKNKKR